MESGSGQMADLSVGVRRPGQRHLETQVDILARDLSLELFNWIWTQMKDI